MRKTVIIGATPNPERVAFTAAHRLKEHEEQFVLVGIKSGEVAGQPILDLRQKPHIDDVDTLTLYIGPKNQTEWLDYIISLKPKRIIFNPGTENPELASRASSLGMEADFVCTLVLLSTGQY